MKFSEILTHLFVVYKKENKTIKNESDFVNHLNKKYPLIEKGKPKNQFSRSAFSSLRNGRNTASRIDIIFEELTEGISLEDLQKALELIKSIKSK